MHTSVRQISISGSSYFLRLDWSGPDLGSGFQLLLTDTEDAWKGEVTQTDLCEEAKELEMENERYLQDLHQALSGTECSTAYSFSLINSGASVSLAFEKVQKDISFRLGSVALTPLSNPAEAVRDLLIYSMAKGNSLERQNNKVEQQNQRLRNEHQHIIAQLEQYSKDKKELESELYSRFVLVLNEKKGKIRRLMQTLNDLQDEQTSYGKPDQAGLQENADEDEYGGSTEDENEASEPKPVTRSPTEERTSPSPLDNSLSDLTDVAPCRKRRVRHLEAPPSRSQKPQTYKKRSQSKAATSPWRRAGDVPLPAFRSEEQVVRRESRENEKSTKKEEVKKGSSGKALAQNTMHILEQCQYKNAAAHFVTLSFALFAQLRQSVSPAALSKEQTPHRSTDAAAATSDAEDLFEDF